MSEKFYTAYYGTVRITFSANDIIAKHGKITVNIKASDDVQRREIPGKANFYQLSFHNPQDRTELMRRFHKPQKKRTKQKKLRRPITTH